ncbi:MAG TPA: methyltransferase domain-containing protein, partial [Polyangiales bacterium]|nr:methyltransferase domain-containing protein [Polyangiales bacterium]
MRLAFDLLQALDYEETGNNVAALATYSLGVGDPDRERLRLLDEHYNPSSRALLESIGIEVGDRIADVGCGHGTMTAWLARRVGPTGTIYALDGSEQQLEIARSTLHGLDHVRLLCATVEDPPRSAHDLDWVYSRFLLLHLPDPLAGVRAMRRMLRPGGQLVLEVPDFGALRFVPADPASGLWAKWWPQLGKTIGASYDVCERTEDMLHAAGFEILRMDRYQPVSARREAKLLHALGFEQLVPAYLEQGGARQWEIDAHRA